MKRALGFCLAVVLLFACGDFVPTGPTAPPLADISDGRQSAGGNPDFFWLPPVAANPSGEPNFDPGEFNPSLAPAAGVAACILANTSDADPAKWPCESQFILDSTPAAAFPAEELYKFEWQTPSNLTSSDTIRVFGFVGTFVGAFVNGLPGASNPPLGYVDLIPQAGGMKKAKTEEFFAFNAGRTIPLKMRIENNALCYAQDPTFDPETDVCATATLGDGGAMVLENEQTNAPITTVTVASTGVGAAGALLQSSSAGPVSTITLKQCKPGRTIADVVDLVTVGDCIDIETDPPLAQINLVGTVSMCLAYDQSFAALSPAQVERLVVYNLVDEDQGIVVALPQAEGFCPEPSAPSPIGLGKLDRLKQLASAAWQVARHQVRSWLSATPLFASLVCDRGGCGGEDFGSPVQVGLPAQMGPHADNPDLDTEDSDIDRGKYRVETPVTIKVLVTDESGVDPVEHVTLTFDPTPPTGSTSDPGPVVLETDANGIATFTWTIGSQFGINTLSVSGVGVATANDLGCTAETPATEPCTVHGVFAPDHHAASADPVRLGTGVLTFTALGVNADLIVESLDHSPHNPNTLDNITFTAVVRNLGPGPAPVSTVELLLQPLPVAGGDGGATPETISIEVEELENGGQFEAVIERRLAERGPYRITATADAQNDVPEKTGEEGVGEDNNVNSQDFTVTDPPDLVVTLGRDPSEVSSVEENTFTAVVTNQGEGGTRTSFTLAFVTPRAEQQPLVTVGPLAGGESVTVTRHERLEAGAYENTAFVDTQNQVPESDEENNSAAALSYEIVQAVLEAASPTALTGTTGQLVEPAPSVRVVAGERPIAGIPVRFFLESSGGTLTGADAVTGEDGVATVGSWTLPDEQGTYQLTVGVPESSVNLVIFTAEAERPAEGDVIPILALESVEVRENGFTYYNLDVLNHSSFPDELFAPAPDLPACGLNNNSSRTWVDIYNQDDVRIYGFCALGTAANLDNIWFAVATSSTQPTEAYIVLVDRRTNTRYTSNRVSLNTGFGYESGGYRFLVVSSGGGPADFAALTFDHTSWNLGKAAFGSGGTCPLDNTVRTNWPLNTDILLRKEFLLRPGTTNLRVSIAVDNDVQVFLNGVDISGGVVLHEGCATLDSFVFTADNAILRTGSNANVLAIRGIDRGVISFLDAKVTVTPP